ncbi:hypothetical protein [Roseateles sp. L2-2]|uniref:hypothetical protein n=1 Tax=Roseateles sp. L2-2 TaxID=3422597 RepID=UPI003D35FE5B
MSLGDHAPIREDLLHLTPEALTHAANAGIVKRAQRELAGGYRPTIEVDVDGQLSARFDDGIECRWPRAVTLPDVRCSCGAAGICRHRIIAALAYREAVLARPAVAADQSHEHDGLTAAADAPADAVTPPSAEAAEAAETSSPSTASAAAAARAPSPPPVHEVGEDVLLAMLPPAVLAQAHALREHGLSIEVRPRTQAGASDGEPCDTARLPSATVRFWAGAGLEAARCDCIRATACEHVALGVWAFREAHRLGLTGAASVRLAPTVSGGKTPTVDRAPFEHLAAALLRHGAAGGASALAQPLSLARSAAGDAAWLLGTLDDLEAWSDAYARRSARHDAAEGVDLIAELGLRLAAGARPGHAGDAWGTGQPGEVELDRLRLTCLGARTARDGDARRTSLVMADLDTGTLLLLRHDWQVPGDKAGNEAAIRASERLAPGLLMSMLGLGQLISRQARRRPDGSLRLARHRSDRNQPLPQTADWQTLRAPLRTDRVAQLRRERLLHPHPDVTPRHAARRFVVFTPADWGTPFYDAHEQTVATLLRDADGAPLLARRAHERHTPHALEAIAQALTGADAAPTHIAGMLRWRGALPELEIWAIAGAGRLTVPDLDTRAGSALAGLPLGHVPAPEAMPDATSSATDGPAALRTLMAALLHHGRNQLPAAWRSEARGLERRLALAGWRALAEGLGGVLTAMDESDEAHGRSAGAALMRLVSLLRLHVDAAALEAADGSSATAEHAESNEDNEGGEDNRDDVEPPSPGA